MHWGENSHARACIGAGSRAPARERPLRVLPALLLTFEGRGAADAHRPLARSGVHAPGGSFHALEASRRLGLGESGGLRVGLSAHNDADDVERPL
ncbi:hypothetical protein GCM10010221_43230 [Streptomyces parvus]|nr:hypothetical protein GCM10010221_43230 [Streptomyces parvus]SCF60031.1 hypothetical protein GA0115280_102966 [Streptomyces sp. Cmuel-A718b]